MTRKFLWSAEILDTLGEITSIDRTITFLFWYIIYVIAVILAIYSIIYK